MSLFDVWKTAGDQLRPGVQYRVVYQVTCLNTAKASDVAANLNLFNINLNPTASLVTGIWGATDPFTVETQMGQDAFRAALAAAFTSASSEMWIGCTDATVQAIEELEKRGSLSTFLFGDGGGPGLGTGIGIGAIVALGLVAGGAYLVWKAGK